MTQEHIKILKKLLLTKEIFLNVKMSDSEVGKSVGKRTAKKD